MCLSTITKKLIEPKTMQFYKIMYRLRRKGKPNLYFFQARFSECRPIEKGKVKLATVGDIELRRDPWTEIPARRYRAGFHGYTNLNQARKALHFRPWFRRWAPKETSEGKLYKVIVLCEGPVRTIGTQNRKKVVVADTMKILREIPLTQLFPTKVRKR